MNEIFITLTGFYHYSGLKPLAIGNLVKCIKEPDNVHDTEAIKVVLPTIGKVAYVANSSTTKAGGTFSAGRVYDQVSEKFYARILFTTSSKVICRLENGEADTLEKELFEQMSKLLNDDWE